MVANEEDYDIQQSQAKPNMGFGNYFEFAKERSSGRLGAGLGAGIGIWNLGISSLQGALGAGIGIWNLVISSSQGALGAGIGIWNLGISSLQVGALGGLGRATGCPPPHPVSAAP